MRDAEDGAVSEAVLHSFLDKRIGLGIFGKNKTKQQNDKNITRYNIISFPETFDKLKNSPPTTTKNKNKKRIIKKKKT